MLVLVLGIVLGQVFHLGDHGFDNLKPLVNPGEMSLSVNADFGIFSSAYTPILIKYIILFVLIGSLESLLSAKAIDLLDPEKRKSNFNKDLWAVGLGNSLSGLLGGLPMISEIARSSANLNNGGRTRWSNFFHGIFLLLFVLILAPFIKMVPIASLAAMLIFVGYRLASPKEFIKTYKIGWEQLVVFISTIVMTLSTDLLIGVFSGILVKIILQIIMGVPVLHYFSTKMDVQNHGDNRYTINLLSSGLFTNFVKISGAIEKLPSGSNVTLDLSKANYVDHSFMEKMHDFSKDMIAAGNHLHLSGTENLKNISNHPLSARRRIKTA